MKCDQVKEHIADYLAGALGRAEAEELDEHFAQCAACKQETEALSQTWEMLGLLEQEQPSAQVGPRFYQSLEAYQQGLKAATAATPGPGKRRFERDAAGAGLRLNWAGHGERLDEGVGIPRVSGV